jgi:hypothetical protein
MLSPSISSVPAVRTGPGETPLTRTPAAPNSVAPNSVAQERVSGSTAAFDAP